MKRDKTMHELNGDESDHIGCGYCYLCIECGDCDKFGCGAHNIKNE